MYINTCIYEYVYMTVIRSQQQQKINSNIREYDYLT